MQNMNGRETNQPREKKQNKPVETMAEFGDSLSDSVMNFLETTLRDIKPNLSAARDVGMKFVRKYPVYTFIGVASIVVLAGVLSRSATSEVDKH